MIIRGNFVGPALIYTLTNALSAAIPFFLLPILTRVLTPEQYGIVAMFSVVVTVFGAFTGLSVHGAIGIRYFEQDRFELRRYIGTCLVILLISTMVVFAAVLLGMPVLERFTKIPGTWLLIAVLVSGAQFVIQIQLVIWQSSRKPWQFGFFRIGQTACDATSSLIFILGLGMAWEGRVGGIALATIGFMAFALYRLNAMQLLAMPDRGYAKDALAFGVPLIPHVIGGMLIVMVDRFLISNVLDVAATGIYMVAMQIGMALGLLTDSFNRAFSPWLIESLRQDDAVRDQVIVKYTYLYFLIVCGIALSLGLSAPFLLSIFIGDQYQSAASIVIYIAMGFAFGGMYYMVTNYIFYAGKTPMLAVVTLVSGLFNIAITYYLLQKNGLIGAAQGFMLSQALTFLGAWWLAQKARPMPWRLAVKPA
ncbi:MAG: oligosaccharide flippase family protein [Herminiimonas sp.]|uniref:lipopolysaccharide biosynthesis protein n=1 Tax=Herminiimonas sp. TaxID=1926289 RepID=UPI0027205A7B|nr:oligosaccharide flippase family protein [Herminiimonas sp.]MDO9419791.1 oligosaccharide flippase family protein [Herminiimonas sp.]